MVVPSGRNTTINVFIGRLWSETKMHNGNCALRNRSLKLARASGYKVQDGEWFGYILRIARISHLHSKSKIYLKETSKKFLENTILLPAFAN